MFGNKPGKAASTPQPVEIKPVAKLAAPEAPVAKAPAANEKQSVNVIGKGTVIEGNVVAEGDLTIEGIIRGDVTTKTTLIVGENSVVEGNLLAQHAEIAGQVLGTVKALGLLTIKASGKIDGDVITRNLNVEAGSTFNGRFSVGTTTVEAPKKAATTTTTSVSALAAAAAAMSDKLSDNKMAASAHSVF